MNTNKRPICILNSQLRIHRALNASRLIDIASARIATDPRRRRVDIFTFALSHMQNICIQIRFHIMYAKTPYQTPAPLGERDEMRLIRILCYDLRKIALRLS